MKNERSVPIYWDSSIQFSLLSHSFILSDAVLKTKKYQETENQDSAFSWAVTKYDRYLAFIPNFVNGDRRYWTLLLNLIAAHLGTNKNSSSCGLAKGLVTFHSTQLRKAIMGRPAGLQTKSSKT